ncbi:MAG: hypothetical protein H7308_15120 [Chthonomonadaceae bacterium]|nr:hypothetical protein [Chthonomonadaceae bacterium]
MLKFLNMFILIGIALVLLSVVGFATAGRFLTEPGQTPSQLNSLYYLGAGVIMLINGIVSANTAPLPPKQERVIGTEKF